ncbi:MAG: hypothetical protein ABIA74_05570 [bacterium]
MSTRQNMFPLINTQIITNKKGQELGVFIEMKDYKLLLEKFEDLVLGIIAHNIKEKSEGYESLENIKKEIMNKRKNGKK